MARLAGSKGHYEIGLIDHEGNLTPHRWEFPSVTTILNEVVAKPKLMHWYYSSALKGMEQLSAKYGHKLPTDYESLKSLMRSEGHSPYAKRDGAGARGTKVHKDMEDLVAGQPVRETSENKGLLDWWVNKGLAPSDILACEQPLVSFKHRYAGTVDLIYKDPETGKVVLCDLKTSQYVHWTYFVQGEAYREAYQEAGGFVDVVSVLHVPQPKFSTDLTKIADETVKAGKYSEQISRDVNFGIFEAILNIYYALPGGWMPDELA